jgi:3-keto-5-aminohexanoate cleavage enzyme
LESIREKLIVTVTPNQSWMHPELEGYPRTPDEMADSVERCYKAGASIAHIHSQGKQRETIRKIRDRCEIIVQVGLSGEPLESRKPIFEEKPDMMSIILTHHDEQFARESFNILHTKPELEEYSALCLKHRVKPEFEVWHLGAIWNLMELERKHLVRKPYFLSIFFGWPGGSWTPPTADELLHRVSHLPLGSLYTTSVMGEGQPPLLALTIALGGHVRVGMEDNPFLEDHGPAKDNSELVAQVVRLSRGMGREVANPREARKMIGLPERD